MATPPAAKVLNKALTAKLVVTGSIFELFKIKFDQVIFYFYANIIF